jgi:Spy/CpxP family protein refolding chaperone
MRALLVVFLAAIASQAQAGPADAPIQLNFNEITNYLNLTDSQLQSLTAIQSSKNQAQQTVFKSISQKQRRIDALLEKDGSDAAEIGQLSIDIHQLRKQSMEMFDPYHRQALALLTQEQQAKLAKLSEALQLNTAAYEAVTLSLVAPQKPAQPVRYIQSVQPIH